MALVLFAAYMDTAANSILSFALFLECYTPPAAGTGKVVAVHRRARWLNPRPLGAGSPRRALDYPAC
jgi:hypothetical protein